MRNSNDAAALPFFERPDLTPFLVHLTKNTNAEDDHSAFDNLVNILRTGEIWGSTRKGYVKGPHSAACFMDIPFLSLKYVLNERNTDPERPRYEPYGVIVSKEFAYREGCRPVVYLSNAEVGDFAVPESQPWRIVRFEGVQDGAVNWSHEREWRSKGDFELPGEVRAVLVKNMSDADRLKQILEKKGGNFASTPATIIPMNLLCQGLPYLA